jgi:hypothetical protein
LSFRAIGLIAHALVYVPDVGASWALFEYHGITMVTMTKGIYHSGSEKVLYLP